MIIDACLTMFPTGSVMVNDTQCWKMIRSCFMTNHGLHLIMLITATLSESPPVGAKNQAQDHPWCTPRGWFLASQAAPHNFSGGTSELVVLLTATWGWSLITPKNSGNFIFSGIYRYSELDWRWDWFTVRGTGDPGHMKLTTRQLLQALWRRRRLHGLIGHSFLSRLGPTCDCEQ